MAKEIKCDICGSPMQSRIENCKLTYKGQDYHTDALVYYCTCGYKKLGTCDVHIWFDDEPEKQSQILDTKTPRIRKIEKPIDAPKESETESEKESIQESLTKELIKETEQEPRLFHPKEDREQDVLRRKMPWPFGHGKYAASDEWLDYMLEKHPWFERFYMRFISFDHRQDRYLAQHKPNYRAIHHNILYDTAKAELFYDETIKDGKSLIKRYYYVTGNDKYFCIRIKYGEKDDMDVKSVDEIKRLLEKQPEIYTKVIHEKVENMEDGHPVKEDEKENTPQETTENTEESKTDPTNGRRPII